MYVILHVNLLYTIFESMSEKSMIEKLNGQQEQKVEILDINDHVEESSDPVVPHERQIIDDIIAIWKEDPSLESLGVPKLHAKVKSRHPTWSVSEKRVRTLLKTYGLITTNQQFTYANEIHSRIVSSIELPPKVKVTMTAKRGKGLYAKTQIKKGDPIWEERPLFFVPALANVNLVRTGRACAYCAKLLTQRSSTGLSALRGLDCNVCPELWCSKDCKTLDTLHARLKHNMSSHSNGKGSNFIDASGFIALEDYCFQEQWNALYALTLIYAEMQADKTRTKAEYFGSMARVSQEVRYKAINSSAGSFDTMQGGALFVMEQQEALWNEGYKKFLKVFPSAHDQVSFEEFMMMMGTYNINNLDSCIFLTQSHLNHSCHPNTDVQASTVSRTGPLKVFAARDIKAGEELTTSYVNPSHTLHQRQRELRVNWGFICSCQRCKDEAKEHHRRKSSHGVGAKEVPSDIRKMLMDTKSAIGNSEIELETPLVQEGERRKSVRFDEHVISVNQ